MNHLDNNNPEINLYIEGPGRNYINKKSFFLVFKKKKKKNVVWGSLGYRYILAGVE